MNVLILGGTTEASALARALAGDGRYSATLSLAGVTQRPLPQPLPVRSGGFGGPEGLARYLTEHAIGALIDATHPFAAQMTRHAAAAARATGTTLLVVRRPPWQAEPGDRWTEVADMAAAAQAIGEAPRRVLLTIGQKDLAPFAAENRHRYVVRAIEAPGAASLPDGAVLIQARGPFAEADERRLLLEHRIEVIVTKNSGGAATQPKLSAARALRLPVIMVARPALPDGVATVPGAAAALAWLARHAATPRGV
ncbi:MAG: cobalt-precorrin-6A reductase [Acetobacteraceae bacterium]